MMLRRAVAPVLLLMGLACGDRNGTETAAGSHTGLTCDACHAGTVSGDFVAPVAAGRCSSCHTDLSGQVEVAHVTFAHTTHPDPVGSALSCTSCHAHSAGDQPLVATTAGCFLCHADPPSGGDQRLAVSIGEDRCVECHVQPTHTAFARTGAPIDHETVLARGISCLLCHYDVVEGSGAVPPSRCRSCHGLPGGPLPERLGPTGDPIAVHVTHLTDSTSLTCTRCHEPVSHAVIQLASALVLDCSSCHAAGEPALREPIDSSAHRAQQLLYAGLDAHHGDVEPALKFLQRVACTSCHSEPSMRAAPGAATTRAINAECVACHGDRFDDLLEPWLLGMELHTSAVAALLRTASGDARLRRVSAADSTLEAAAAALALVESAHGVHNIAGADRLLRAAVGHVERSYRHAGLATPLRLSLGPDPATVTCVRCHYGIELQAGRFADQPFEHGRHVVDADIACSDCHGTAELFEDDDETFDPDHGATRIGAADCASCHHVERPGTCVECHAPGEVAAIPVERDITVRVARDDVRTTRSATFSHAAHEVVACGSCHRAVSPERPAVECASCHREHHTEVASPGGCTACHTGNVRREHERVDHLSCAACHASATLEMFGSADRAFCLQCHNGQQDHEPAGQCSTCHLQLSPGEAMRQILDAAGTRPPRESSE